ncbi:MAG: hypothetical protein M3134_10045 [Actinomycetota bacterium]|nr:hypothetical protein [Actinomycetota bacterium]
MAIRVITGPPGNGKSFFAVDECVRDLIDGKVVATNVRLTEGWAWRLAAHNPARRLSRSARARKARELERRYFFSEDLGELMRIRLHGTKEGRGKMLLDEAHNWMNSRAWSKDDRADLVRFFTQHRKLGWNVDLICQDLEMLDKQVRNNFEEHTHMRNLKKVRKFGVPLVPFNLFLAITTWHATGSRVVLKRDARRLRWTKDLYDTHATSHGLIDHGDDDTIWLPAEPPPACAAVPAPDVPDDLVEEDGTQVTRSRADAA